MLISIRVQRSSRVVRRAAADAADADAAASAFSRDLECVMIGDGGQGGVVSKLVRELMGGLSGRGTR